MWDPSQLKEAHIPIGNWVGLGWAGLVSIYPSTRLGFDWVSFNSSIHWKKRGEEREGSFFIFGYYSVLEA